MIPIADYAEPDEIRHLQFHLRFGVRAGECHQFFGRQIFAVLLLDKYFDRHAVAIPAGHIDRVKARQLLGLDDNVLQNLVARMTNVDRGVSVRRAIVQNEFWPAFGRFADFFVELSLLPLRHPMRFALGEVTAHREWRIRQIQRFFVINFLVHLHSSATGFWLSACRHAFAQRAHQGSKIFVRRGFFR